MIYNSTTLENAALLSAAESMCAAARTAPKTKGVDRIVTLALTGDDKDALADKMESLADELGMAFFKRDAGNLRAAGAVVLIGTTEGAAGLGEPCSMCHFKGCEGCGEAGAVCVFNPIDLGIAVGSAVSVAADARVDTRVMFSVGRAALASGLLGEGVTIALGIPMSISGKSPFFDRK